MIGWSGARGWVAGVCLAGMAVGAPVQAACPGSPAANCKMAGSAKLSLKKAASDDNDLLMWTWAQGDGLSRAELGDPVTHTGYSLCLYAGTAQALVGEVPMAVGAGWKDLSSGGYGFSSTQADGIRFVSMKPGAAGKSNVGLKGKGGSLPDPLPLALPLIVQLQADPEPLCLEATFASAAVNSGSRFKAQAQVSLPPLPGTIPVDDPCNINGNDGSVATQLGAQMRRSGSEWASTCLATYGSAGSACNIGFPGNTPNSAVPESVPSLVCPNTLACDDSLGRVEWHAENKFARKCTLDQWALVWAWIQNRAGAAAPPDCDVTSAAPRFWGVYSCYEQYYVHPLMVDMLNKLRDYAAPNPPITPACEGALVNRMWFKLARDWIRMGNDTCHGTYHDVEVEAACNTDTRSPMIDEATLDAWCDDFTAFLRPVYEGVRAASGKPY